MHATGFQPKTTDAVFVGTGGHAAIEVTLQIGTVEQHVVVTATVGAVPQSQVGAAITVLDSGLIEALGNTELLEPLRTVPGVAVVQTGARGGATSLFVRGGASNFTKVLIDGVPANDIGGAFDFADLTTTGVDRVEVLRGSNSVLYGSDALTGVINITTTRGHSRTPDTSVSIDGGNLGTSREEASLGGAVARFDYFGAFSHLQTDNSVPNNAYRNNTFASRFGVVLGSTTSVSGTVRHIDTTFGSPNAFDYFGVADDSSQARATTYASIAAESQWSHRWSSTARFSVADQQYHLVNPSPTGLRSDPSSFANYLGNPVTITDANGDTVSGRAILDFGEPTRRSSTRASRVVCSTAKPSSTCRRRSTSPAACASKTRTARRGRSRPPHATTRARSSRRARCRTRVFVRERRSGLRPQRDLRLRVDAARVGGGVSAAAVRRPRPSATPS